MAVVLNSATSCGPSSRLMGPWSELAVHSLLDAKGCGQQGAPSPSPLLTVALATAAGLLVVYSLCA